MVLTSRYGSTLHVLGAYHFSPFDLQETELVVDATKERAYLGIRVVPYKVKDTFRSDNAGDQTP